MDPTVTTTTVEERKENTDDLKEVTENVLEEVGKDITLEGKKILTI